MSDKIYALKNNPTFYTFLHNDYKEVVCKCDGQKELTFGKTYSISNPVLAKEGGRLYFRLINDKNKSSDYLSTRFVTIEEFRELKLSQLGI